MPRTGGFSSCPQTVGPWDVVSWCTRPGMGLAAVAGREVSFATELPGMEFPATVDPIPKDSISRNYPLPPSLQTSSAFPSKSLAWGHVCRNRSGADPWEHWGLEVGAGQVHSAWLYLHQVPPIKTLSHYLPCEHHVSCIRDVIRSSETAFSANKKKWWLGVWGFF